MSTKVAVVTGGNKGIGLAIVRALCTQFQGDVYLTARDVGRGQEAVEALAKEGLKSFFQQLDIDDLSSITTAAAFFREKYGGVDVLINNAGIAFKNADTTPFGTQAEVTLRTNFFSTRNVLTHFLPLVKAGGRVVNVSSFVGVRTLNGCSPELQQRFRSPELSEDELLALMQSFVEQAQRGEHQQNGWPQTAYGVSKTGLTALSMILARRLSKERPNDGTWPAPKPQSPQKRAPSPRFTSPCCRPAPPSLMGNLCPIRRSRPGESLCVFVFVCFYTCRKRETTGLMGPDALNTTICEYILSEKKGYSAFRALHFHILCKND